MPEIERPNIECLDVETATTCAIQEIHAGHLRIARIWLDMAIEINDEIRRTKREEPS